MADRETKSAVDVDDIMAVHSRISWGAILSGAVAAVAMFLLLTLLGSAIGLSVEPNVDDELFGWGAIVWAITASLLSMLIGGWITSLCTAGENRREAAIYGLVTWAMALGIMLWLVSAGVGGGLNAMMGMANIAAAADQDWAAAARRAGIEQQTIDQWRASIQNAPAAAAEAAQDPANQEAMRKSAEKATWGAFAGMVLSLAASIAGSLLGAGPTFRLMFVPTSISAHPSRIRPAH
jgi:hypothetical protein